ncbi:hypothetical protein [Actibacterium sp. D379-3]
MIRQWFILGILGASIWSGMVRADALETCRAANPQFPQLCECAIARSQAEGIEGPVLDRLLANLWDGVPTDVANRYGMIFVECTQAAVSGNDVAVPIPPVPPQENARTHGEALTTAPEGAVTTGGPVTAEPAEPAPPSTGATVDGRLTGVPAGYQIAVDAAPGNWVRGTLDTPYGSTLVTAVRNVEGRHLALRCEPGTMPVLLLGPFDDGVPGQGAQIVVLGNGGMNGRLFQQGTQLMGFNRNFLAVGVTSQQFLDALRRGNTVEVRLDESGTEAFELRGSSRAIDDSRCAVPRSAAGLYPMGWEATRHDPWRMGQAQLRNGMITDALFLPMVQGMAPHLALTCDRRLISQSRVSSYDGSLTGEMVLSTTGAENVRFPVHFEVQGHSAQSPVLDEDLLDVMARADTMSLTFDVNAEPGTFTTVATTMAGFAEGLPQLTCPAPPGAALSDGGRDLTGAGEWATIDTARPGEDPYYLAVFEVKGAPALFLTCRGAPSIIGNFTSGPSGSEPHLRLQIDNDPSRTMDSVFYVDRYGMAHMDEGRENFGSVILQGSTLRITNLSEPRESFLYPLDGLLDAIAAMPPPCRF